jgi:hypothetical protein
VLDSVMVTILLRQVWSPQNLLDRQHTEHSSLHCFVDKQIILAYCWHAIYNGNIVVYQDINRFSLLHGADWRSLQGILRYSIEC